MYTVIYESRRFGRIETSYYQDLKQAKRDAGRAIHNQLDHDSYSIFDEDNRLISSDEFGYSEYHVLLDLKSYARCCREEIGGWELYPEAFRWLALHEYIVPADDYLRLECGAWIITDKFREIGAAIRDGLLDSPPEFNQF